MIGFQGTKISSDTGFRLLREIDDRFGVIPPVAGTLEGRRSPLRAKPPLIQMIRQKGYQIAAGYEDCNEADLWRIDPALRPAIGKAPNAGAGQSMLSRLENDVLGTQGGLRVFDDALMRRKKKQSLIVDVDSSEDPAHGKQENVAFNGHLGQNCFYPLFAFTSDGDCLGAKLRHGNFHLADGVLSFLDPIVKRYRSRIGLFRLCGNAAFAYLELYACCETERITNFIRLAVNAVLNGLIEPYLARPVARPPKGGIQIRLVISDTRQRRGTETVEWSTGLSGTTENSSRGSDSL